jgi:hypothetical protein
MAVITDHTLPQSGNAMASGIGAFFFLFLSNFLLEKSQQHRIVLAFSLFVDYWFEAEKG